jgi:Tol biopolymer transport system component
VSIPAPNVTLQPNQQLKLAKAQPDGQWELLDTVTVDGKLTANVTSFSFFTSVIVTYVLPIASLEPFRFDTTLTCGGTTTCTDLVGPTDIVFTLTGNNGQLPQNCTNPTAQLIDHSAGGSILGAVIPLSGHVHRVTALPGIFGSYYMSARLTCGGTYVADWSARAYWHTAPSYPQVRILRMPAQVDVVEGLAANVDVVMSGGNVRVLGPGNGTLRPPTADDRAIIDWQRSDDAGASWRTVARSFQNEGNPLPFGGGLPWRPWSVRHGFIATSADQGALIRLTACYTPPSIEPAPCVTGTATRINVLQQSALPAIATQPRSVLIRTAETANFSVSASGAPTPTLQWQTRPANSTGSWTDVTTGTGGTTLNYTTAPGAISDNGVQYRVVATNAVGSAASAPVTVSVSDLDVAPSITAQPASLSVTAGGDAVFAVDAFGTEAMSYQWRANGVDIAGANSAILRLAGVTNANAGAYTVSVTNSAGTAVSSTATLTVTASTPAVVAPTLVAQPVALAVNAGQSASFAVGVSGTGPLAFQWRRDGVNIAGATSAVLTFANVALPNAGMYSVVVSNAAGATVSNNALLEVTLVNVSAEPTITSQPATLIVPAGGSGILAVGATGSGPISYQWSFNGVAIPGATSPVLSLNNVGNAHVGSYQVAVTNPFGTTNSNNANFILLGAPVVTQQPASTTANQGDTATFTVAASGSDPRYTWMVNGSPIGGANAASYTTPTLVGANSGAVYSVIVHNGAGLVFSQGATLTVQVIVAPTIVSHPANVTIAPGAQAEMCVTVAGTPSFDLQLQRWNGASWIGGAGVTVNSNSSICYFTDPLTLADTGAQFRYSVGNPAGTIFTNAATVTVQAAQPPAITDTTLVSRSVTNGLPDFSSERPSMSADGNLIAFISHGNNVHEDAPPNPCNCYSNAYVRNMATGVTRLINYNTDGDVSLQGVHDLKLSSNGRYAVFSSHAGDLVAGDTNGQNDIFRRDLQTGTTQRISVLPNGDELPNGVGGNVDDHLAISADGRIVTFRSGYDLTTGAANAGYFLYYVDAQSGFRGMIAGSPSYNVAYSALSDNGEYVAYVYGIPGDAQQEVRLYDIEAGGDESSLISWQQTGGLGLGKGMSLSSDGRFLAFGIRSPDLTNTAFEQVIVVDRNDPGSYRIASAILGTAGNGHSGWPQISGDGRYVVFSTTAPSLTNNNATPSRPYVVVGDVDEGIVTLASVRSGDGLPVSTGTFVNEGQALSEDGNTLAFVPDAGGTGMGAAGLQVYARPRP